MSVFKEFTMVTTALQDPLRTHMSVEQSKRPATWLRPLGIVMEPDPRDPREVEGVLNPAVARGTDGDLYLLPRLVAAGNFSRIGLARVIFNRQQEPWGVERLGVVLEPDQPYERHGRTGGGVEDPRVTYLAARREYVMTYTAYGPLGPRIALAVSHDLRSWRRLGLARFTVTSDLDLNALDNKDAVLFPEPVPGPDGTPSLALIHRPDLQDARGRAGRAPHPPGMWISYAPWRGAGELSLRFDQHHFLARPRTEWEHLKIGAGAPPSRVGKNWLLIYHGVTGQIVADVDQQKHVRYSAGAILLSGEDPRHVLYRSSESILEPTAATARVGVVPNVVFPTGVDLRANGDLDVYYGMADTRIGVARASLSDLRWPDLALAA
jgi:predicted GH43/DUF377 family glycosyl hydrolase